MSGIRKIIGEIILENKMKKLILLLCLSLTSCASYSYKGVAKGTLTGALGGFPYVELEANYRKYPYKRIDLGRYDKDGNYRKIMYYPTRKEGAEIFTSMFHNMIIAGILNASMKGEVRKDLWGYIGFSAIWGGIRLGNNRR